MTCRAFELQARQAGSARRFDPCLARSFSFASWASVVDPFTLVVVFVDLQNVEVETDGKFGVGPRPGEQEPRHFGGVDLEHVVEADHFARRARNLPASALDAEKVVLEGHRGFPAEHLDSQPGRVEAAALAVVVFTPSLTHRIGQSIRQGSFTPLARRKSTVSRLPQSGHE